MMPFMGVRISWLMLARKSALARAAASAATRAASSSRLAWVRSSCKRFAAQGGAEPGAQLRGLEGLGQIIRGPPEFKVRAACPPWRSRRQDDDRKGLGPGILSKLAEQLEAVYARQTKGRADQVEPLFTDQSGSRRTPFGRWSGRHCPRAKSQPAAPASADRLRPTRPETPG